jgi:hypothetical protein
VTNSSAVTAYNYSGPGFLADRTQTQAGRAYKSWYTYNTMGAPLTMIHGPGTNQGAPGMKQVSYSYSNAGRPTAVYNWARRAGEGRRPTQWRDRVSVQSQDARAIAEALRGHAHAAHHVDEEIRHGSLRRRRHVTPAAQAAGMARQQQRQVVVRVPVAVA